MSTYNYLVQSLIKSAKKCDKVIHEYRKNNSEQTNLILLYVKHFEDFTIYFIKLINYLKTYKAELRYYGKNISATMMNLYDFLNSINTNDIDDELLINHNYVKHLIINLSYTLGLPVTLDNGRCNCMRMVYQLKNIYKR